MPIPAIVAVIAKIVGSVVASKAASGDKDKEKDLYTLPEVGNDSATTSPPQSSLSQFGSGGQIPTTTEPSASSFDSTSTQQNIGNVMQLISALDREKRKKQPYYMQQLGR
jgi:hypothetical protein